MVALNFQTPDLGMQLNQGRFEYNGYSGYLLKPEFLRSAHRKDFDPNSDAPVDGVIAATCTVHVLSLQFFSETRLNTNVEVDMYGLPCDTIRKEFKTRTVASNGLVTIYNQQVNHDDPSANGFVFRKVVMPDLAVLRIAVCDETGKMLAQRILPLEGLQAGYRHLTLRSDGTVPLPFAVLFCRFNLDTYVPEGLFGTEFVPMLANPLTEPHKGKKHHHHPIPAKLHSQGSSLEYSDVGAPSACSSPVPKPISAPKKIAPESSKAQLNIDTLAEVEALQNESKAYQKLIQQQQKELEKLKKKQSKEKLELANKHYKHSQSSSSKESPLLHKLKLPRSRSISSTKMLAESAMSTSEGLENQVTEYADLMQKCLSEERDCQIRQAKARMALSRTLLEAAQEQRFRDNKDVQEKEMKELLNQQTKRMRDRVSEVVEDKSISRHEKERRTKEIKASHIKLFAQERRKKDNDHSQLQEQVVSHHSSQLEILDKKLMEEIDEIERAYEEERIGATRPQLLV